jgi:hypothetical protein
MVHFPMGEAALLDELSEGVLFGPVFVCRLPHFIGFPEAVALPGHAPVDCPVENAG